MVRRIDELIALGDMSQDDAVTVGMLVWRVHRTLTTVRLLVKEESEATEDDMVRHLLDFTARARTMASRLIDAVNARDEWGPLCYQLVDAVTAVVGVASYLRPLGGLPSRVWQVLEDTLGATRDLAKRARAFSLEVRILLAVESSLHPARRERPARRLRRERPRRATSDPGV